MKCISLFVCFFIGLQSMIVPSYEVLISNIEPKSIQFMKIGLVFYL